MRDEEEEERKMKKGTKTERREILERIKREEINK
jgi:hypothetical protein